MGTLEVSGLAGDGSARWIKSHALLLIVVKATIVVSRAIYDNHMD